MMNKHKLLHTITKVIASALIIPMAMQTHAQSRLNFGLTQKQPEATLPKGKAPFYVAIPKKKTTVATTPVSTGDGVYMINNGWELAAAEDITGDAFLTSNYKTNKWLNATVPGTVLTTLVDQGIYPDPYIGLNNMAIPDTLCRKDWWYRLAFTSPKAGANKIAWLQFDGINYKAQVWLNGKLLGNIDGAFVRGLFDVTKYLKNTGNNILAVHILPPHNPGIPHEQSFLAGMGPNGGQLALDGPTFISSEGWDWVPGIRDRNIGIWQPVKLKYTDAVTLHDPQVITDLRLPDTSSADITIKATVQNHSAVAQSVMLKGVIDGITFSSPVQLKANETKQVVVSAANQPSLHIVNPRLWWPNGYGNPSLYTLKLQASIGNNISDEATVRFGIREMSYELMADAPGKKAWRFAYSPTDIKQKKPLLDYVKRREFEPRVFIPTIRDSVDVSGFETLNDNNNPFLVIRVNGKRIFCKGGNWGMDDGMKRVTRERLEPAFKLHREANYNMIRNWTGESTEEVFYELADEYGLLVWNDFWISTEGYNLNPSDQRLWLNNSLDVIKRFRNHPSIAIWCPRNEGYAPVGIEDELATQLAVEDGTRHYIGNSREINLRPSGDWHYIENPAEYFTKYAHGFSTEIGTFSVPVASTLRKFIKPEDQWPIDDVWHYHDLHSNNQNLPGYLRAVDSLYGKPTDLNDFNRKVQLINYNSHRAMFEAWNSKLWQNTSGVLLWMTHPAWPSMIWQTYSWDFETHGSYFGAKKACEPLHVQMNLDNNKIIATNTSLDAYSNLKLLATIHALDGSELLRREQNINVASDEKVEAFTVETASLPSLYLVRLQLIDAKGNVVANNDYWKATNNFTAFNQLPDVNVAGHVISNNNNKTTFVVENKTNTTIVGIKLNALDSKGNIVLPAYFSDGYFTLLPGEQKQMTLSVPAGNNVVAIKTEGYNNKGSIIKIK